MAHRFGFVLLGICAALALATPGLAAGAGGVSGIGRAGADEPTGSRAYEKIAWESYQRGRRHVERAGKIETNAAAAADPVKRDDLLARARAEYGRALRQFDSALSRQSDLHQVHSDRGYVLRKLGDYREALEAYDRALALEAGFAPAIEYRGEAYLELGRLEDAKGAYLSLAGPEPGLARQLLSKMQDWVARHRRDPGDVDPAEVEVFAGWIEERARIADAIPAEHDRTGEAAAFRW